MSRTILPKGVKHQLERLNAITQGPGALKLSPKVSAINLQFYSRVKDSSYGAKQFWRKYLPPIQFYNPELPISVHRYTEASNTPSLTLSYTDGTEKKLVISGRSHDQILDEFVIAAEAEAIPADEQAVLRVKELGE